MAYPCSKHSSESRRGSTNVWASGLKLAVSSLSKVSSGRAERWCAFDRSLVAVCAEAAVELQINWTVARADLQGLHAAVGATQGPVGTDSATCWLSLTSLTEKRDNTAVANGQRRCNCCLGSVSFLVSSSDSAQATPSRQQQAWKSKASYDFTLH